MKEGNTIAPYTFRRVSINSRVREAMKMLLKKNIISLIPKLFLVDIKRLHVSQSEEVLYQLLMLISSIRCRKLEYYNYADQLSTISCVQLFCSHFTFNTSFIHYLSLQEKAKYLFSFNFVALNFVLPQLEQVNCLHILIIFFISICFASCDVIVNQSVNQSIDLSVKQTII